MRRRRESLNVGRRRRGLIFIMQNSIQEGGERNKISPSEYNEWPLLLENSSTKPENIFKFVVRERKREGDIFRFSALAGRGRGGLSYTTIVFGFNLPPSLQKIATSSTKFW